MPADYRDVCASHQVRRSVVVTVRLFDGCPAPDGRGPGRVDIGSRRPVERAAAGGAAARRALLPGRRGVGRCAFDVVQTDVIRTPTLLSSTRARDGAGIRTSSAE